MSAQADGTPVIVLTIRDVILRGGVGASLVLKPYWLLPLRAVDGGVPITRH